jgi:hypothetical protein
MGRAAGLKILTVREVRIKRTGRPLTAVLVDTEDSGEKIVLLFYMGDRGWWTQVYDAK